MLVVAKVIYFQLLWYFSVYLGSKNQHSLALGLCFISLVGDYFIFRYQNIKPRTYVSFVIALACIGILFDTSFLYFGLLSWPLDLFYPLSLLGIWIMFAVYYPLLFSKFENYPFLSFILGAVFGPLAYWSGSKIGAIGYNIDNFFLIILHGFFWGSFFSLSIRFFKKLKTQVI